MTHNHFVLREIFLATIAATVDMCGHSDIRRVPVKKDASLNEVCTSIDSVAFYGETMYWFPIETIGDIEIGTVVRYNGEDAAHPLFIINHDTGVSFHVANLVRDGVFIGGSYHKGLIISSLHRVEWREFIKDTKDEIVGYCELYGL